METILFSYCVKVSLSLVLFYGVYFLFFRNDTFLNVRRIYFLSIILFSLIFPLSTLNLHHQHDLKLDGLITDQQLSATPSDDGAALALPEVVVTFSDHFVSNITYILIVAVLGSIILLFLFILQIASIIKLRLLSSTVELWGVKIIELDKNISPFSFFGWIFVNPKLYDDEACSEMITHETIHSHQFHSFDVVLSEVLCILFWWNPVVWFLRKEIKLNLEYLADYGVLNRGYEAKKYQYLLLQISNVRTELPIVNNFNVSQLKKRIAMINKERTSLLNTLKYLLVFPLVILMLIGNSVYVFAKSVSILPEPATKTIEESKHSIKNEELISTTSSSQAAADNEFLQQDMTEERQTNVIPNQVTSLELGDSENKELEKPFTSVEVVPRFSGGDSELMRYLSNNIKYPKESAENGIQGQVVVRYVVSKTGEITNVQILRSLDEACDNEAVRVVKSMPKWIPGKQNGQNVPVYYTLPIRFKLK